MAGSGGERNRVAGSLIQGRVSFQGMAGCARGERGGAAASRDDERWGGGEEEDEAVAGWTGARRLAWVVVAVLDDSRARAELCGRAETSERLAAPTSATSDTPRRKARRGAGRLQVRVGYILVKRLALASQAQSGERRPSPRTSARSGRLLLSRSLFTSLAPETGTAAMASSTSTQPAIQLTAAGAPLPSLSHLPRPCRTSLGVPDPDPRSPLPAQTEGAPAPKLA